MRMPLHVIVSLTMITAAFAWGCSKTPKKTEPAAPVQESQAASQADKGQGVEGTGTKAPEGADAEPKAEPKTEPKAEPLTGEKAKLAKAYIDIYCAQRKGETEKLLEIYTRYGFEDPKTWTDQWTGAAEDKAWVARITQQAIRTCP